MVYNVLVPILDTSRTRKSWLQEEQLVCLRNATSKRRIIIRIVGRGAVEFTYQAAAEESPKAGFACLGNT